MFIQLTGQDGKLRLINFDRVDCILPVLNGKNTFILFNSQGLPFVTDESYEEVKEILNMAGLYK